MSFNADQIDYMRSMGKLPREQKCYCAWFKAGECPHCPADLTAADRAPLECPSCGNYPPARNLNAPVTHNIACKRQAYG